MSTAKVFYLSQTDKKIAGVCGGLAEYFSIDSTLVRISVVLLALVTGGFPVIFVYIVTALVAPSEPPKGHRKKVANQ